jgi:hypothetical protein
MLRSISAALICLATLPALCQSSSKYQVATIADVKQHQAALGGASEAASYDVTLKVGGTVYTTLYTPPLGTETVKYAAGRQLLVVGEKTIKYNDILGRSVEVPIISQKPVPEQAKQ